MATTPTLSEAKSLVVDLTLSDSSDDSSMTDTDEDINTKSATATASATVAAAATVPVEPVVADAAATELNSLVTIRNGIQSTLKTNYSDEQQLATIKWLVNKPVSQQRTVAADTELANLRIMVMFIRDTLAADDTVSNKLATVTIALL
jgi:hypothetical protein